LLKSLTLRAPEVAAGQVPGWTTQLADASSNKKVQQMQRTMKFCTRLEALSFWGCHLDVMTLWDLFKARNDTQDEHTEAGTYTTIRQSLTSTVLPARRVIKPLRRTKLASQPEGVSQLASLERRPSTRASSSNPAAAVLASPAILQAMRASATQPPSFISYLRLAGCRGVDERALMKLVGNLCTTIVWSK